MGKKPDALGFVEFGGTNPVVLLHKETYVEEKLVYRLMTKVQALQSKLLSCLIVHRIYSDCVETIDDASCKKTKKEYFVGKVKMV